MKKYFIVLLVIGFSHQVSAQEWLGANHSNYSPTNTLFLNPSSTAGSPVKWELNLIGLDLFFDNNLFYIEDASIPTLFKAETSIEFADDENSNVDATHLIRQFEHTHRRKLQTNIDIRGLGLNLAFGGTSVGFFTRVRTGVSLLGVSPDIGTIAWNELDIQEMENTSFSIDRFRLNAMVWSEIGIHFSQVVVELPMQRIKVGTNLRYLQGYGAAFLNTSKFDLRLDVDQTLYLNGFNGAFGYTDPESYDQSIRKGTGFGADLGFSWELMDGRDNYIWKFGFSVLDLGGIRFNTDVDGYGLGPGGNITITDSTDLGDDFSSGIVSVYTGEIGELNSFSMGLPTAASFQVDRRFNKYFYLSGAVIQRIPKRGAGLDRENLISITPRFESRDLEFALPIHMYQYIYPRLGAALRFKMLTVGTDRLGAWTGSQKLSGFDFYFSLKINSDLFGRKDKRKKNPKSVKAGILCFNF